MQNLKQELKKKLYAKMTADKAPQPPAPSTASPGNGNASAVETPVDTLQDDLAIDIRSLDCIPKPFPKPTSPIEVENIPSAAFPSMHSALDAHEDFKLPQTSGNSAAGDTTCATKHVQTALEWQLVATILDRIFLILFTSVTLLTSVIILTNRP